MLYSG
ncbi:putative membrane protein, partial [Vibrio harveyi]